MSLIKTILVDDEKPALKNLERLLSEYGYIEICGMYTDGLKALEHMRENEADLVFLDIEMPDIKGIDLAKKMRETGKRTTVVFVTAYDDYALDAFKVNAMDYVMKPIMKRRLDKTMERIEEKHKKRISSKSQDGIFCFGGFEIRKGQNKVKWRTYKAKELAAYLVHNRGDFVNRSKIIRELWGDKEDEQAVKLLHTTIYYLRNALKSINMDKSVVYSNEMYRFDVGEVFLDFQEFEKIFRENKDADSMEIEAVKKALELYRGEYFHSNQYCWAEQEQSSFSKMYSELLAKIADFYMKDTRHDKALEYLEILVSKNPYDEEVHEKLLESYLADGDLKAFKRHYKKIEETFSEELGVEPCESISSLYKKTCV